MRAVTQLFRMFVAAARRLPRRGGPERLPRARSRRRRRRRRRRSWVRASSRPPSSPTGTAPRIAPPRSRSRSTSSRSTTSTRATPRACAATSRSRSRSSRPATSGSSAASSSRRTTTTPGMGACDSCNSGRQFPSAQLGIRAQIQHLRNFADLTSRAATLHNPPVVEWYGKRSNGTLDPALGDLQLRPLLRQGHRAHVEPDGRPAEVGERAQLRRRRDPDLQPDAHVQRSAGHAARPTGSASVPARRRSARSRSGTPGARSPRGRPATTC